MNIDLQFTWVAESGCDDNVISEHRKAFDFDDDYPMFFSCDEPDNKCSSLYVELDTKCEEEHATHLH